MSLKVFKQTTYEGCLPVCLLSLAGINITREKELRLLDIALKKDRDTYYAYNNVLAFVEEHNLKVNIYLDDLYYKQYLDTTNRDKRINILYVPITKLLSTKQKIPFIVYVDIKNFGEYTHAPHFIIVEKQNIELATILEPWAGKKVEIKVQKILDSIYGLRDKLLYAPLIISLEDLNYE